MSTLQIIQLQSGGFKHIDSIDGEFFLGRFSFKQELNKAFLVEAYGAKRREYNIENISVFAFGGSAELFTNWTDLINRLIALSYTGIDTNRVLNFVPLNGTTEGNPITGDVEMTEVSKGIWIKGANFPDDYFTISFGEGGISLSYVDVLNGNSRNIIASPSGIVLNDSTPGSKGLDSPFDYSANLTELSYVQKIYVDAPSTQTQTQRNTATSGTQNIDDLGRNIVFIHEAGLTASLTINLPATPKDSQIVTITSVGGITSLTLATPIGSIVGMVTALTALASVKFIWLASQSKWYKIN